MKNRIDLTRFELQSDICDGGLSAGALAAIGAGISAAGGIGSAAINAGARWGSSTYMRVAKEMANYNSALSEDMYNKYQSPAAMMRQYKEAGLNPYLVYGNTDPASPVAGQVSTNPSDYESDRGKFMADALSGITNGIAQYQQIVSQEQANTNAKITQDILEANARKANADAEMREFKASHQQERYDIEKSILSTKEKRDVYDLTLKQKYKELEIIGDLEEQKQRIASSKMSDNVKAAEIRGIDQKIEESKRQVRFLDEKGQYLQWEMKMGEKRYSFDVANAANANYWRGQDYNLRVRAQDAKEKYQDGVLKQAKQALGYKMYQDTRRFMYGLAKDAQDRQDKMYYQQSKFAESMNPYGVALKLVR